MVTSKNCKIFNKSFYKRGFTLVEVLVATVIVVVLAGGIGARAKLLFEENGVKVITGVPMDSPESLVNQYLSESLVTGDNICDH